MASRLLYGMSRSRARLLPGMFAWLHPRWRTPVVGVGVATAVVVVLLLAVIRPLVGLDYQSLSLALAENRFQWDESAAEKGSALGSDLMKSIIAEQTGAYILDKANALGVKCAVEVECKIGEENLPYPISVRIKGTLTDSQRDTLRREIEADFAIPAEMQLYESGDVE
jgi:stage III sporulation protein AF